MMSSNIELSRMLPVTTLIPLVHYCGWETQSNREIVPSRYNTLLQHVS